MIKKQLQIFLLGWAILFGFLIRATPAYLRNFPLNDGGMFFTMVEDLISANLNLPETTSYNGLGIPYSYPPFAFYLLAFVSKHFHVPLLDLFKWTPVILSTLSIVAIYFLAKELTNEPLLASISSLSFAMLPATTTWLIMGGGVTRSFGMFFSILTIIFSYRLYISGKWKDVILTSLFGSLLVYSHPEWTIQTVSTIFLFFVGIKEKKRNIFLTFIVAISVLLITMPWWLRIFQSNPSAHFNAIQTGLYDLYNLLPPIMLTIGREPYFPIITLSGIFGVAYLIISRKIYWLGIWFLLPFIADPRIAFSVVTIPLSIASSYGLIILSQCFDFLGKLRLENLWVDSAVEQDFNQLWKSSMFRWVMGFFIIYSLLGGFGNILQNSDVVLDKEILESFDWVRNSIPHKSNFLVITGEPLFTNPIQEWFYPMTKSNSLTTYQGVEWLPNFYKSVSLNFWLQDCKFKTISCLDEWRVLSPVSFEYIYLYDGKVPTLGLEEITGSQSLSESLKQSEQFDLIYQSENVKIFSKLNNKK